MKILISSENPLKKRQLPLNGENLAMVMDLSSKGLVFDHPLITGRELDEFGQKKFKLLTPNEIKSSLSVTTTEFQNVLSQVVPCVGCRRSVEKMYSDIMNNGYSTLEPIKIKNGMLTVCDKHIKSSQLMCTLLHTHDLQLNQLLENQPRNKKNSRCSLHSLDSFRTKPFSETWFDTWDSMKQNCKDKVAIVEAQELHATLDNYLKKHKFCQECRTKVEKAYTLLMNEANPSKEKGYVNAIYHGIKRCLKDKHIHLPTKADYIDELIKRAEPELIGSHSRHRERHAKTMEIAQEEVLNCVGMCIYDRLKKIHQCVREEENACQVLGAVAVYALCRSFDMAVENKRGVNLELIYDEISRDERNKEQRKEQKKLKKRKKRIERKQQQEDDDCATVSCQNCAPEPENCICLSGEEEDDDEISFVPSDHLLEVKDEVSTTSCISCHSNSDERNACTHQSLDGGYSSETQNEGSCSLSSNNNSSRTSSIASTPEGSEVACSDGCCNHSNKLSNGKHSDHGAWVSTLEQMLEREPSEEEINNGTSFIPDEDIIEFRSRDDIKQKREELRESLLKKFNDMCKKKCCVLPKTAI